ncbi:MAG: FMN-binding negative transcriptional regulator [Actinomycetales bacterium]
MLIHPWDAAVDEAEWRAWLAASPRFGVLAVNNLDPSQAPFVLPSHVTVAGDELLMHLARPNPVWPHLQAADEVRVVFYGDYAYIPGYWRNAPDVPPEDGVPTSYYAAVELVCRPTVVDDPEGKAEILVAQLGDFQPEGSHAAVATEEPPYARLLPGIRGIRLAILRVEAKFKYDDAKPVEHRERVAAQLEQRGGDLDAAAAVQQRRRLAAVGDWQQRRS